METLYDILQLKSDCSLEDIKNAYRQLCKIYHPDRNPDNEDKFLEIKKAYEGVYIELKKNIEKSVDGTLNQRWLEDYVKNLEKEIEALNIDIETKLKNNIDKVVSAQINSQLQFFNEISDRYGLGLKETFSSMFSTIKTDVIKELIHGDMYKDRKGLSERIWKDTTKFKKDINTILIEGIAQKKDMKELAKDLEIYVNPKATKEWNWRKVYPGCSTKVDYNAQRLARTSIHHAYQQALKRSCEKNPFVDGIEWRSALIHGRTCKLCNERHGIIYDSAKKEGNYTTEPVPIDHPNGLCTLIPVIGDLEDIGTELREWIDGESNLKLDLLFKNYGKDFIPK